MHGAARNGLLAGIGAYFCWGLMPLYLKLFEGVAALDLLAHRVLWSSIVLALVMLAIKGGSRLRAVFTQPKLVGLLCASTAMIGINWFIYTWAVLNAHVLDASLGYFIQPLFNVVLGVLLLGERFGTTERIAFGLALVGVAIMTWAHGALPWLSLALAFTFGIYAYIRKQAAVDAVSGLLVETALLAPLGLIWLEAGRMGIFGHGTKIDLLLVLSGVVSTLPLALFGFAARRLTLSTLGFLQYLAPTMVFGLAVFVFAEPISNWKLAAFGFIWTGLAVYSLGGLQRPGFLAKR